MNIKIGSVHAILAGKVKALTDSGVSSGIDKHIINGLGHIDAHGMQGDEQADLKNHGGKDKAIHLYAFDHYATWRQELGELPLLNAPGAFGENISTLGIFEENVYLGDQLKIGNVLLEVSQGRQPCWKLNHRFNLTDMAQRVQSTLRTGIYCRVISAGSIQQGDAIFLVNRVDEGYSIQRIMKILLHKVVDQDQLVALLKLPLVASHRKIIEKRLHLNTAQTEQT